MATPLFSTIAALAGLLLFALAVAWVRHSPPIGMGLVCLSIIPLWEVPYAPPLLTLSGLNIYPTDVITGVLFLAGALELTQLRANLGGWLVPWVLFGAFIAVALIRGVAAVGPGTAINEARSLLYFFFARTWVLAVRPDRLRLHTVSLVLGWALVLVAVYHGVRYGIGSAGSWASVGDGSRQTGRVLVASQALPLLLSAGTLFLNPSGSARVRPRFAFMSSLVFLAVVLLAQHRSVWGAAGVGMVAVLLWSGRTYIRQRVFVLLIGAAWLALVGWISGVLDPSSNVDAGEALDTRTYRWRTSSWQSLIDEAFNRGPVSVLGGEPFGTGYLRQLDTGLWTSASPHNWYVMVFLRLGLIGLFLLVAILISALAASRGVASLWTFVIAAVIVYGWSYNADWFIAPWLGAAITVSLGSRRKTERSVSESVPLANCADVRIGAVSAAGGPRPLAIRP